MRTPRWLAVPVLALSLVLAPGCGGDEGAEEVSEAGVGPNAPVTVQGSPEEDALIEKYKDHFDFPMVRYSLDPKAGDPAVPAELGGPGFTGEGWTTRLEYPSQMPLDAPKGGSMRLQLYDWPATLRILGENSNTLFNGYVEDLCAEGLLGFDSVIMDYVPLLASHWQMSEDKMTYRYRINPEARWSDGTEVTAEDVVATWKLMMDETIRFPSHQVVYSKFHEPVAKSKYIVEVQCKEPNWRNFLYFSASLKILPAKHISMSGEAYLEKYQNSYTPMTGPYMVLSEDIRMGQGIALTRRKDYWGEKNPGLGGGLIDKFLFEVVKDPNLAYEKVKKGELDFYVVPRAQWWATEIPEFESVKRGLLQMCKVYNDAPIGISGFAINMKRPPLDDLRVRKALQFLYNRFLIIEKLCYGEYEPLASYHQGGVYQNPGNELYPYDPEAAVKLLEEAGWTEKNDELYRVKDGKVLQFEMIYALQLSEKFLVIFQEDCKKAGIRIDLKLINEAEHWKNVTQKEFELASQGWTGLFFPNPETSFLSRLADEKSNNNITGFKDPRVDELCGEYDRCYDMARRIEIIKEIDGIVYGQHPYVLSWFNPAQRFLCWNKYGMPPWGCSRTARSDQIWYTMWVDPAKEKALEEARKDPSKTLETADRKNLFWRAWNAEQRRSGKDTRSGR